MKHLSVRVVTLLWVLILCFMFVASVFDSKERRYDTNFNQENILTHVEKLSEVGPHSLYHKEANERALDYIVQQLESYGITRGNTVQTPAYLIQDFVTKDKTGLFQDFSLQNLIVHIPGNAEKRTRKAIMFMSHFDSAPTGQGASDDAVACGTMLEAIRYYIDKMNRGYTLANDLVFCFVNGEEYDLYGSHAFMKEFRGFDSVVYRIKFATNLESRGTDGTLVMFETSPKNYKTVKLFSEINQTVFTCSIATMVYDMMPNVTDFTNFKQKYQGLNMANIAGGEDYHTQNDSPENIGLAHLSQQAQIVDRIIEKLGSYNLLELYKAEESAIFFSYLNMATVVYDHTTAIVLAGVGILLLVANILISLIRKQKHFVKTAKAILAILLGILLSAGVTYLFYFLFQLIAAVFGVINIHMVGTIVYSNIPIVIGIGLTALAGSVLTTHFTTKWFKITGRDLTRAFAYIHGSLGIALSFLLPEGSYLFMFSGILLLINELLITCIKKIDFAAYHFELLATALYFPIVIPIVFLATSALGLTMTYVYGIVFALTLFAVGIAITPLCRSLSIRLLLAKGEKKPEAVSPAEGGLHILALAMILFLVVCSIKPNAYVNLQGGQGIFNFPYDDALIYVQHADGSYEHRICDLNAYRALKAYSPHMEYRDGYYVGQGEKENIPISVLGTAKNKALTVRKNAPNSVVYLEFHNIQSASSFVVDDGITSRICYFHGAETYLFVLHRDCTITLNGKSADVTYTEVFVDYPQLIPAASANDRGKLHFNLWLTATFELARES